jgi:hypothetical protein
MLIHPGQGGHVLGAGVAADEEIKLEAIYSQLGTLGGGKLIASRPRV